MVLVYPIDAQSSRHFVERMHFEEAEFGARNGQENRNRTLTTDPGRFNVPRARLAPAMISTPGPRVSRRRQREALPAWSPRIAIGHGVFLLDREGVAYLDTTDLFSRADFFLPVLIGRLRASLTALPA
jgi:hypothetical protein